MTQIYIEINQIFNTNEIFIFCIFINRNIKKKLKKYKVLCILIENNSYICWKKK